MTANSVLVHFSVNLPDYVLQPVDEKYARLPGTATIADATPIHSGNEAVVFKGQMSSADGQPTKEVVLKFVAGRRYDACRALEREFGFYKNQLFDLQGTAVPECYGLFTMPNNNRLCLILQYCGESIETDFDDLLMDSKLDIIDHLMDIHEHGVQHCDLAERNVTMKDGKPFIIDFGCATSHECKRKDEIWEGTIAPDRFDFGCTEIYNFCYEYRIWRSGYLPFLGIPIRESRATSIDDVLAAAREHGFSITSPTVMREEAQKVLRLVDAIKRNDGFMPRAEDFDAFGIGDIE